MRSKSWYSNYPNYFWNDIVSKGTPDKCWPVKISAQTARGYGRVRYNKRQEGAHRVAHILSKGPIPKGLQVCHKCDNPPCCNPDHLFLGTGKDNTQDCIKKGRKATYKGPANGMYGCEGEKNPCHKLTNQAVKDIRHLRREGALNTVELARLYQVTQGAISAIVQGRVWKHLPVGPVLDFKNGSRNPNAKLTEEAVKAIRHRHQQGEMQKTLALEFKVNRRTIERAVHGKLWRHVF